MSALDEWLLQKPNGLLYHYTSASGFIGIVQSGVLWASSQQHLNDKKESRIARLHLEAAVQKAKLLPAQSRLLQELIYRAQATTFIASFSRKGDLLSQWRAYCGGGEGYSLGFRPDHQLFTRHAPSKSFSLLRCVYEREEQKRICEVLIAEFVSNFDRVADRRNTEATTDENVKRFFDTYQLVYSIVMLTAALKHWGFAEEHEWRLVCQYPDQLKAELAFRQGRFGVVPFVKIPVWSAVDPDKASEPSFDRVVIGPNSSGKVARESAELLLAASGVQARRLRGSVTPYRHR